MTRSNQQKLDQQLQRWRERLLDLSKTNPLLCLNRSRVSRLLITKPGFEALFKALVEDERSLRLPQAVKVPRPSSDLDVDGNRASQFEYRVEPGDIAFAVDADVLAKKVRRIYDNARTSVQERGVITLHVAFGLLEWSDPRLGEASSPVLLVPCELEYLGPSAPMRLKAADEDFQVNPALELLLRDRHKLQVPVFLETADTEAFRRFFADFKSVVGERGWTVSLEAWLSTFSFESLVLYRDLFALQGEAGANSIVTALARVAPPPGVAPALSEEELDDAPTPDEVPVPVLPADSSQLKALALARAGRHLVIHGPPGTGKSQTIVNLIADALGRQKTVLFVSAKMAALEVVHRRLAALGLARFCLEAHSTKAGKAKIIDELRQTLAAAEADAAADDDAREILAKYVRVRKRLNQVVHALHSQRPPLGVTPYEAMCKMYAYRDAPDVEGPLPWPNLCAVSRQELDAALEALSDLAAQAETFDGRASHPWRGLAVPEGQPMRLGQSEVLADLRSVRSAAQALVDYSELLRPVLGELRDLSLELAQRLSRPLTTLVDIERLPRQWNERDPKELEEDAAFLRLVGEQLALLKSMKARHEERWNVSLERVLALLGPGVDAFAPSGRVFRLSYWRWRKAVRLCLRSPSRGGYSFFRRAFDEARRLKALEQWFADQSARIELLLGSKAALDSSVIDRAVRSHQAAIELRAVLTPSQEGGATVLSESMRESARRFSELAQGGAWIGALRRLDEAFSGGFVEGERACEAPLHRVLARCNEALASPASWHEWVTLQHTLSACGKLGLKPFIEALGTRSVREAPKAFQKRFYKDWTDAVLQESSELAGFVGARHEERVAEFRRLDERLREAWLAYVRHRASEPARRVLAARGDLGTLSEVGILRRELQKQRRFRPLRRLFSDIPNVLQALKPCMMMSPLSVSTFLEPGKIKFDLVIFDEASQLPTAEGIPSIVRGRQVIVAGDAKQLPPTSFFRSSVIMDTDDGESEEEDEVLEPLESLLDDCVAIYPVFDEAHLRWHYRSRDERLIAFSNHYFYREKPLITFPSAWMGREDRGVRWEYVQHGVWARGESRTNRREAERVVELICEHAEKHPERSLGVVTMNLAQRELVEELLDEVLLTRPEIRDVLNMNPDEPFFIKALENVQGDERDTMIISVGYGRTASGELKYNFGPLNQDGGWRRLNVLVTRARWQTILVTSLRAADLAGVKLTNRGAAALRDFIEYAETGCRLPDGDGHRAHHRGPDLAEEVAEALAAHGYSVDRDVGLNGYRLDLAIRDPRDPERYVVGIELDGPKYRAVPTARDRNLLHEEVLQGLGWRLHRVWAVDWFRDRQRTLARVISSIEQAMAAPAQGGDPAPQRVKPRPARSSEAVRSSSKKQATRQFGPGVPYRKYRGSGQREILMEPAFRSRLAAQIGAIVSAEGPIHQDLLVERLREINDVDRIGSRIALNIRAAIRQAVEAGAVEQGKDGFLRKPGAQVQQFRVQGNDVDRPPEWIPPEEIELAILHVVEDQFACQRDALPKAVAGAFGWMRIPRGLTVLVEVVVDRLIHSGRLTVVGETVSLP